MDMYTIHATVYEVLTLCGVFHVHCTMLYSIEQSTQTACKNILHIHNHIYRSDSSTYSMYNVCPLQVEGDLVHV